MRFGGFGDVCVEIEQEEKMKVQKEISLWY